MDAPRCRSRPEISEQIGEEGLEQRHGALLDGHQLERPAALPAEIGCQEHPLQRGHSQQCETARNRAFPTDRKQQRAGHGWKKARLKPEEHPGEQGNGRQGMAEAVWKSQRINLVAAVEHRVGKAGAAEEHADNRPRGGIGTKSDKLARDDVRAEVRLGEGHQTVEGGDRVPLRAKVERDEVRLAVRQHRDGRQLVFKVSTIMDLGQRRLHRPVPTVYDEHFGPHARNSPERVADLLGTLYLIMEYVGMLCAIVADARKLRDVPRRLGVRQQCDPWTRHP